MSYISCNSNVCKQYRNECSAYIYGKTKTCKILKISKNYIEKEIGGLGQKKNIYPGYHCVSFDSLLQFALETSYWLLQQGFNRGYKQGRKMWYKGFCYSQVPLVSFVPLFLLVGRCIFSAEN